MVGAVVQPSFAAGEVSPTMYGRVDLAKFKVGAALLRNYFVDYRGGVSNRPGTRYIQSARYDDSDVRLIPFKFNVQQQYVLEFGHGYIRFYRNGGQILENGKTVTAISNANPGVVSSSAHGYANGEWVYLSVAGMYQVSGRTFVVRNATANTFTLETLAGVQVNTSAYAGFASGAAYRVYTLATPYQWTDLFMLKFTQTEDVMTIVHTSYQQRRLVRLGDNNWQLNIVNMAVTTPQPSAPALATTAAGTTNYSYVTTAVGETGEESIASSPSSIASANLGTTANTITITTGTVGGLASYYNFYKSHIGVGAPVPAGEQHGWIGSNFGSQFVDANVLPDFTKTPPIYDDPFARSTITDLTLTGGGSGYTSEPALAITGTGSGASYRAVLGAGGSVVSFLKISGGIGYDPTPVVSITGGGGTGATATAVLGPATGTWPGVVATFQQRMIYGGTANNPNTVWGSQVGMFNNFSKSVPSIDSDAYSFKLLSNEINQIKSMVAMPGGLVVLTAGGAWQMSGGEAGSPITPSRIKADPQAYNGCNDMPPIVVNYEVVYVQALGSSVRSLSYNFFANIYTGTDMSVLSNHLFDRYTLRDWAYAEEPFKIIWVVRSDGKLLSFTFLKEQEVYAWARHDTLGQVKSICSIIEGTEHAVYMVIKRYVNGIWRQYVERMVSRLQQSVEDAWFVDSGLEWPMYYPAGSLYAGASVVGSTWFYSTAGVFVPGHVGVIIRMGGGRATITGYTNANTVTATIDVAITNTLVNGMPVEAVSGQWNLSGPTTVVTGLEHLEGMTVSVLADGNPQTQKVVANGAITLDSPATRVIVGLPYQAQMQTLPLDTGEPTTMGKRKKISGMTIKVNRSRGLRYGLDFGEMNDFKLDEYSWVDVPTLPITLISGERYAINDPKTTSVQQMCFQQDDPLPSTILAVVPEITLGDTDE